MKYIKSGWLILLMVICLCGCAGNEDKLPDLKEQEAIGMAQDYLTEKYPGSQLEIIEFENAYVFGSPDPNVYFIEESDNDKKYQLTITEENDEYVLMDNFYGALIREKYDRYLMELLEANGFAGCITYTDFPYVKGVEIDGELTVSEFLDQKKEIGSDTDIFIEGSSDEAETLTADLEAFILEENIYGSYGIYVLENMAQISLEAELLKDYVKEHDEGIYHSYFNTFGE